MSEDLYTRLVDMGRGFRKAGDEQKWEFGRVSAQFCDSFKVEIKPGRPRKDYEGPTLTDYARDVGEDVRVVSATVQTHRFYPENVRTRGDFADLSWRMFNRAREASGGQLNNAVELLEQAVKLKLGVNDFGHYLAGEYFEGMVEYGELPERLREFVPAGRAVWVKVRAPREGE